MRATRRGIGAALVAGWLLLGCEPAPGATQRFPLGDPVAFTTAVQPILAARCANPGCHGDSARPLELYAEHQHRLDPNDVHRDLPLTDEELQLNYRRTCATLLGVVRPEAAPLLLKPLAEAAGGAGHAGGPVFFSTDDPELQALWRWVSATVTAEERR